ncbi:hypothetical protein CFV354_0693 [Campylobacter fetus subsp. venerealis NCTC 10354]|nr:hypothetical protein CFV354_0693 [Campylobacter fetus subsp. venerealis NCTC 10354]
MFSEPVSMELIVLTVAILVGMVSVGIFLVNRFKENR